MPDIIDVLSRELIEVYGSRKKEGRLSLLVDTTTNEIYIVPKDTEHIEFTKQIGTDPDKVVPVHVDFLDGRVAGVITGESGLEQDLGVRHSHDDLNSANSTVYQLIIGSGLEISPGHRNKICVEYAK
ncbi:hypothetical protein KY343_03865 [Candidatus Woesearchaeota archaeon]|nr:hypothetical protein [Candidatus Woesearchaeota archaeon]